MSDLTRLKQLLGILDQDERQSQLHERVDDPKSRSEDVAAVLPQAIRQSPDKNKLVNAMRDPVFDAWRQAASNNPKSFAETLFPVMAPAIRGAVADSLKGLIQKINQAMEHTISPKGIRWRLEAWRSGLTYGEVVLRNTLVFRVEQVFLIDQASGLLLAEDGNADLEMDEDAISGMLTAVQDFIRDSVGDEHSPGLRAAEIDDRTLWVIPGPIAQLALLISGQPRNDLRPLFSSQLRTIHETSSDWLAMANTSIPAPLPVTDALKACLLLEEKASKNKKSWTTWAFWALLIIGVLGWSGYQVEKRWRTTQKLNVLTELSKQEAGIVLYNLNNNNGRVQIGMMADPLATSPEVLIGRAGLELSEVDLSVTPFQSLEQQIVWRRLIDQLPDNDNVQIDIDSNGIRLSGYADDNWLAQLEMATATLAAEQVDRTQLQTTEQAVIEWLSGPETINLSVSGNQAELRGNAPLAWIDKVQQNWSQQWPNIELSTNALTASERFQLDDELLQLKGLSIKFGDDTDPVSDPAPDIERILAQVAACQALADQLGLSLRFVAVGFSDSSGTVRANREIEADRATWLQNQLRPHGITTDIQLRADLDDPDLPRDVRQVSLTGIIDS